MSKSRSEKEIIAAMTIEIDAGRTADSRRARIVGRGATQIAASGGIRVAEVTPNGTAIRRSGYENEKSGRVPPRTTSPALPMTVRATMIRLTLSRLAPPDCSNHEAVLQSAGVRAGNATP